MLDHPRRIETPVDDVVSGEFLNRDGERYYAIRNVDRMAPFFISVVSNVDHWLFVSSSGGLTAGRVSPESALFPYITVDRIHESALHTGCRTLLRVTRDGSESLWEPFNSEHHDRYAVSRNIYKNLLGNKLCFEEINHDLELGFRYTWETSDLYGFVRRCELENLGKTVVNAALVDGLQNILPAGTPSGTQASASNLVDAYKWNELDSETGLALYTLYSAISDRAEPCESLRANTVFCLGLDRPRILLSSAQLDRFRNGEDLSEETQTRGVRGAYLVHATLDLEPGSSRQWRIVADSELNQAQVVDLRSQLAKPEEVAGCVTDSVNEGSEELSRIMAAADAFQSTAEENVSVHHYANVLFNVLRGGLFAEQYTVPVDDFAASVRHFNRPVYDRNKDFLAGLPDKADFSDLLDAAWQQNDPHLNRLSYEYLPITFGRRHGDPSRPWNRFEIRLKDSHGNRLLSYQGNWRDIFQNWEALAFSYPEFVENVIAKFVNASTMDGYNPYRITKQGIDWEIEDPDDPWSYIGYWGDHQIVYLLKLLELSSQFHPTRLARLLREPSFAYADVPYRIKPFADLLADPKNTVTFDHALASKIGERVARTGADGKLVPDRDGDVYQVNLLEKLLVPLLAKLGNLVVGGGVWLNTQRPEWNDANNALVGHGLSMVTLFYMRRYVCFLQALIRNESGSATLSTEVGTWLSETSSALAAARPEFDAAPLSGKQRFALLEALGKAADRYRSAVYAQDGFAGKIEQPLDEISVLLDDTLAAIDHSIASNRRSDGLYHAYNLLDLRDGAIEIETLYAMLEGQVAALSSGAVGPEESLALLEALFESDIYRADQHSFMLYPDRALPAFLEKNRVPAEDAAAIPLVGRMLDNGDKRLIARDADGHLRFNADLANVGALRGRMDELASDYGDAVLAARDALEGLYEKVFRHRAFTGRSGGMFGFEGLGCIYWHMVSKLLLAIQERYFAAAEEGADASICEHLGAMYYRVRDGLGFNKTPEEYGAFPTDPYSHTTKHSGARQPGMTGQVKEEVLTRFGELGIRVRNGRASFEPGLLRRVEFSAEPKHFCYLDVDDQWQSIDVPANALAFTWAQTPVIFELRDDEPPGITIVRTDKGQQFIAGRALSEEDSGEIFRRSGKIRCVTVNLRAADLFGE